MSVFPINFTVDKINLIVKEYIKVINHLKEENWGKPKKLLLI